VTPAFYKEDSLIIKKVHKTLLMFRREESEGRLELRHQRTGDVVADFVDPGQPNQRPNFYVYHLIETLLPQAAYEEQERYRMIEL